MINMKSLCLTKKKEEKKIYKHAKKDFSFSNFKITWQTNQKSLPRKNSIFKSVRKSEITDY